MPDRSLRSGGSALLDALLYDTPDGDSEPLLAENQHREPTLRANLRRPMAPPAP